MFLAEQTGGAALADRLAQALDRQRVLGAAVHVAFGGADRVGGDQHALDHAERVALEHGAVHEGAGIALVGVADEVLLAARLVVGDPPLAAGREAGAAAPAQAGGDDLVADLGGRHRHQRLGGGAEAAGGQRRVQAAGIDHAAVGEHDLGLPREEGRLPYRPDALVQTVGIVVAAEKEAVVQLAVAEHRLQELVDGVGAEVAVAEPHAVVRHQVDEDLALAVADAAGLDDRHAEVVPPQVVLHLLDHREGAVGAPAGAGADVEDHAVSAPAGARQARRALLAAGVVVVADRPVVDTGDRVGAGRPGGVPAARAARGHELAVVHARLASLRSMARVQVSQTGAVRAAVQAAASALATATSSSRESSFSTVR